MATTIFVRLIFAGELTSKHQPDYRKLVDDGAGCL